MAETPAGSAYLRRSLALLWGYCEPPARGPKPGLTLDQIVSAAVKLADTEGMGAVSMRRVAGALGVGTMSLYRYVPGKGELLDLMIDKVSDPGEAGATVKELGWREALTEIARGSYQLYLAHPWLLRVNAARPAFGPGTLAGLELYFACLAPLDLTDREKANTLILIDGYVTGTARQQIQWAGAAEETGVDEEEFWRQTMPVLEREIAAGGYPAMAALDEDTFGGGWEETFEFGLQRVLDGLAALLAGRAGTVAGRERPTSQGTGLS